MVSVPKVPVNSSESREAAVRSASEVSILRVLQVGVVTMSSCWCVEVGEVVDATVDVGVGALERGVGIDGHRVGNRPVQPRKGVAELFVGVVADGDDEIIVVKDVVERLGAVAVDAESVALGNGDGPRVDA